MINKPIIHQTITSYFSKLAHYLPQDFQQLIKLGLGTQDDKEIKVLIVDDHHLVRQQVRKIVEGQSGMEVIGEATNGEEAIKLSRELMPDVILMDINMPGIDGIEATRRITAEMPNICIIGLSTYNEEKIMKEMKNAGASSYLTKAEAFESLIGVIRTETSYTGRVG